MRLIAKRPVVSLGEIVVSQALLNLYGDSKASPKRRVIDTTALLSQQGFVVSGQVDREAVFKITAKGKDRLAWYAITKVGVPKSASWDQKWYIVTFDLPEKKKIIRNNLILQLKAEGFINYAKGLWVLPYNPAEYLKSLRKHLGLSGELKLIIAESLEGEDALKTHFNLT